PQERKESRDEQRQAHRRHMPAPDEDGHPDPDYDEYEREPGEVPTVIAGLDTAGVGWPGVEKCGDGVRERDEGKWRERDAGGPRGDRPARGAARGFLTSRRHRNVWRPSPGL